MNHPAQVGVVHGVRHLLEQLQPERLLLRGEHRGARPDEAVQGRALDQVHRNEELALLGAPRLVDPGDARVLQSREGLGLAHEHALRVLIPRAAFSQDLERHAPPGLLLLRLVDDTHAACPDLPEDAVTPDGVGERGLLPGARGPIEPVVIVR